MKIFSNTKHSILLWHRIPFKQTKMKEQFRWCRGGSRTAATSKMERFVIIVNGFQPLTIITKRYILDVASVLDPPLGWEKIILDSSSKIMLVLMNGITTKYLNVVFDELITGVVFLLRDWQMTCGIRNENYKLKLTHYRSMLHFYISPENVRNPEVFLFFYHCTKNEVFH